MNHIEHDDPMKTPPRKKQKVSNNIHAVSYSSGVDITDQREIISPMKDWNMFYDDRQDEILYQTWTGDEMTIKDKIHNEIEKYRKPYLDHLSSVFMELRYKEDH